MAASGAEAALGLTFAKGGTGISEITSITGPSTTADTVEVTHYTSDDGYKEFVQTFRDGGEIVIEGNLDASDDGQVALITDLNDGSSDAYTLTLPNTEASTWTFSAIVTAFETLQPRDGVIGFSATLKVTGKALFTV